MREYSAYGLSVSSPIMFRSLPSVDDVNTDVEIKERDLSLFEKKESKRKNTFSFHDEGIFFRCEGIASFLIEDEERIAVHPDLHVDPQLLRLSILGPAMAIVLSLRDFLVLHASAVELDGEVIAFLGPKGAGKSTTAAAMHQRGYRIVTDDVLVVDTRRGDQPLAVASPPLLKVRQDTLDMIGKIDANEIKTKDKKFKKKIYKLKNSGREEWLPIDELNFIKGGKRPELSRMKGKKSIINIICNIYNKSMLKNMDIEYKKSKIKKCKKLAENVKSYTVERKEGRYVR